MVRVLNKRGKSILIVDSDEQIRDTIRKQLEDAGFDVLGATSYKTAKDYFLTFDPCFCISELLLPDRSGYDLCKWIRKEQKSEIPLMVVSGLTDEMATVKALRLGADDFIRKPFRHEELIARVETVLRRTAHRCSKISYRGIVLKPLKGEVRYQGHEISLTLHEFRLLYFLMRHPNQTLTRHQILDELYPTDDKIVSERTIDVHILKLREKFKVHITDGEIIESVRGIGYRFIAF